MNRTREEFVALHQHHFLGMLLDAVTQHRSGAEMSMWLHVSASSIKERLGKAYDDLKPKEPLPTKAAQPEGKPTNGR